MPPIIRSGVASIHRHIKDLLQENECVIVPNMGGIIRIPSQTGSSSFKLSAGPGAKKLSFNNLLSYNDGLLANYIVKKENLSYDEALKEIDNFVIKIQSELNTSQKFVIEEVGVLYLDASKKINIEPIVEPTPDETISQTEEIASEMKTEADIRSDNAGPVLSGSLNNNQNVVSRRRKTFITLFAVLSAITLAFCVYLYFSGNEKEKTEVIKAVVPEEKPALEESSAATEIFPIIERGTDGRSPVTDENRFISSDAAAKSSDATETKVVSPASSGKFYAVAGSFKSLENSKRKLSELKSEGYVNAIILSKEGKLNMVCFDEFNSQSDADAGLLKIKERHPEAWIFKK